MTIKQILKQSTSPELEDLLCHTLKQSKEFLYLNPDYKLTESEQVQFKSKKEKWQKGYPLAYILGYKYFFGHKFKVNKHVLIPRPESEWLVERVVQYLKASKQPLKILDMGTGSGILITSVELKYRNQVKQKYTMSYTAADISSSALKVARANQQQFSCNAKLIKSDLFSNIAGKFHAIVANLPYVPAKDYMHLYPNLRYEPKLALTDNTNDSFLLIKFLASALHHLHPQGRIFMELDPISKKFIQQWNNKTQKYKLNFYKDLQGLTRYAIASKI